MSDYIRQRAVEHEVTHQFSGKWHFFSVKSENDTHSVAFQLACDCKYMAVQGIANGEMCSHILAVMLKIEKQGRIEKNGNKKQISDHS